MQRLKSLNEIYQKRLIRPEYAHHQATPYSVTLDPTMFNTDGSVRPPLNSDSIGTSNGPFTQARTANAFTLNTSLTPGLVLVKTLGEQVGIATGSQTVKEQPFGLLANWIGGDFDEIGPLNVGSGSVGAWRGPDATFTLLFPAYNDAGTGQTNGQSLSTAFGTAGAQTGVAVNLYAGTDGRLFSCSAPTGTMVPVARLLDRPTATRIVVDLAI